MRVTPLGKIVVLLLALGAAFGGWNFWKQKNAPAGSGNANSASNSGSGGNGLFGRLPKLGGGNNGGANGSSNGGGSGGDLGGGSTTGPNDILLVTSASKKGWLQDEIKRFNEANEGKYRVTTKFVETREAMHSILESKIKPALWCPSSTIWTSRLAQVWKTRNQTPILDPSDAASYRVFFRTPLVFITTQSKARFLRPLLGGPRPWDALARLSNGKLKAPWGKFKYSHADPLSANSGMMTVGLMLNDYAEQTGQSGEFADVATSDKFKTYMQNLERAVVLDLPSQGGSSAQMKAWVQDPSRYDFITNYENSALEAAAANPQIAVIYPNPTAVSEQVVSVLKGDWVSDTQREGAQAFMAFLGGEQSLQNSLRYKFRPAQSGGDISLAPELARYKAQGFQQSFSAIELPPYEALNAAAFQWRIHVAKKPAQGS